MSLEKKTPERIFSHFFPLFLIMSFFNLNSFASSSELNSLDSSAHSEEEKILKRAGKRSRKKIHLQSLKKLLVCSTNLVESQYGKTESSLKGLEILEALSKQIVLENYTYDDLQKKCDKILKSFKERAKKKEISKTLLNDREARIFLTQLIKKFKASPHIVEVAKKAINPVLKCHKSFGWDLSFGVIGAFSFGWDHYSCSTPLGRKYHMFGPSVGGGLGIGVTLKSQHASKKIIEVPLFDLDKLKHERNRGGAFVLGKTKNYLNKTKAPLVLSRKQRKNRPEKDEKSKESTFGLGYHKTEKRIGIMKGKGFPDFKKSGLYELLKVPSEIHL